MAIFKTFLGTWEQKENKTGNMGIQGKFFWEQGNIDPHPQEGPQLFCMGGFNLFKFYHKISIILLKNMLVF